MPRQDELANLADELFPLLRERILRAGERQFPVRVLSHGTDVYQDASGTELWYRGGHGRFNIINFANGRAVINSSTNRNQVDVYAGGMNIDYIVASDGSGDYLTLFGTTGALEAAIATGGNRVIWVCTTHSETRTATHAISTLASGQKITVLSGSPYRASITIDFSGPVITQTIPSTSPTPARMRFENIEFTSAITRTVDFWQVQGGARQQELELNGVNFGGLGTWRYLVLGGAGTGLWAETNLRRIRGTFTAIAILDSGSNPNGRLVLEDSALTLTNIITRGFDSSDDFATDYDIHNNALTVSGYGLKITNANRMIFHDNRILHNQGGTGQRFITWGNAAASATGLDDCTVVGNWYNGSSGGDNNTQFFRAAASAGAPDPNRNVVVAGNALVGPGGASVAITIDNLSIDCFIQNGYRNWGTNVGGIGAPGSGGDHHLLSNLIAFDDHTQYLLLAGRAGGQTAIGGTAAGENLTLQSTANAARGEVRSVDAFALRAAAEERFYNAANTFYVGFKGGAAAANLIWTLPLVDGAAGNFLKTDGAGTLSWAAAGAGASPLTTKGDIWGYDVADNRIPVGTDGKVLTADSAAALGVSWQTPTGGSSLAFREDGVAVSTPSIFDIIEPDAQLTSIPTTGTVRLDLSQYALLAGRDGGQVLYGGLADPDVLWLRSNQDAPGFVYIGGEPDGDDPPFAFDEEQGFLGIGTTEPGQALDVRGAGLVSGFLAVGPYLPLNQNDGDITGHRLLLGNDVAFGQTGPTPAQQLIVTDYMTDTSAGAKVLQGAYAVLQPAGASSSEYRVLNFQNIHAAGQAQAFSGRLTGGYFEGLRFQGSGTFSSTSLGGVVGVTGVGAGMGSGADDAGTITEATGVVGVGFNRATATFAVKQLTTARGLYAPNPTTPGGLSIPTYVGLDIDALSVGTVNIGFRNQSNSRQTGYARFGSQTIPLNTAAGVVTSTFLVVTGGADSVLLGGIAAQLNNTALAAGAVLRFYGTTNNFYSALAATPVGRSNNITYSMPDTDPTAGQVLTAAAPVAGISAMSWGTAGGSLLVKEDGVSVGSASVAINLIELDTQLSYASPSGTINIDFGKYALLEGRADGQQLAGGQDDSDSLWLTSTADDRKGFIYLADQENDSDEIIAYDEAQNYLGIGTREPDYNLDLWGTAAINGIPIGPYTDHEYVFVPDAAAAAVITAGNQQGMVLHTGANPEIAVRLYVDSETAPGASGLPITIQFGDTNDLDTVVTWTTIATKTLSSEKSTFTDTMLQPMIPARRLIRMNIGTIVGSPADATITLEVKRQMVTA